MQDGLVVVGIETLLHDRLGGNGFGGGQRLPGTIANPQSLLLARLLDVVEADESAILFELVFNLAGEREGLGASKVDVAVLQGLSVVDCDGDEAAGLGLASVTGPLENADRTKFRRVFGLLDNLTGILRTSRCSRQREDNGKRCGSCRTGLRYLR
jgi:hypothetical protein